MRKENPLMSLRFRSKALAISVAAATLSAGAIAIAAPVSAAAGPVITHGSCGSSNFSIQCQITWSGGTDPSTVRWIAVANSSIGGSLTNPSTHSSIGFGNCIPNGFYEVKATVTDAHGLSASTFLGGNCDG
jgi:hypothetical protein